MLINSHLLIWSQLPVTNHMNGSSKSHKASHPNFLNSCSYYIIGQLNTWRKALSAIFNIHEQDQLLCLWLTRERVMPFLPSVQQGQFCSLGLMATDSYGIVRIQTHINNLLSFSMYHFGGSPSLNIRGIVFVVIIINNIKMILTICGFALRKARHTVTSSLPVLAESFPTKQDC